MSFFDKQKYKTYDTSKGFGGSDEWMKAFESLFGGSIEDILKDAYEKVDDKTKERFHNVAEKIRKNNSENLALCKTVPELKAKFRELMFKYHPDKAGNTKENNDKCAKIIESYEKNLSKLTKYEFGSAFTKG